MRFFLQKIVSVSKTSICNLRKGIPKEQMKFVAFLLVIRCVHSNLRSKAGDERDKDTCVVCTYLDLEDICFPAEQTPHGSKWSCDQNKLKEPEESDLWTCLMTGDDSASCTVASRGACIWCAEPVLGLCVTPEVASKLNYLPYFTCDSTASEYQ